MNLLNLIFAEWQFKMEHYEKGETVELPYKNPFEELKDVDLTDVVTMRVKHGSKVRNLMGFAMRKIKVGMTTLE